MDLCGPDKRHSPFGPFVLF